MSINNFTVPNTFRAGMKARASEVNENFEMLAEGLNIQAEEITNIKNDILDLDKNMNDMNDKNDELLEAIEKKANLDLDNISDEAKLVITNLLTPDYTKRIARSVTTASQTSPFLSWLYVNLIGGGGSGSPSSTITIGGVSFYQNVTAGYGGGSPTMYLVGKDVTFSCDIPRPYVATVYSIPCKGV